MTSSEFECGGDVSDWLASPGSFCAAECSPGLNDLHSRELTHSDTCKLPTMVEPERTRPPSSDSVPTFEPRDKPVSFFEINADSFATCHDCTHRPESVCPAVCAAHSFPQRAQCFNKH